MGSTDTPDACEFCGGEMQHRIIRVRFHYGGETLYVDRVPTWVCAHCGEQYFDAPVYKQLETIARQRGRIKKTISFPLAEYDKATV